MTSEHFLESIRSHYNNALPFVAYSKPGASGVKGLLQNDSSLNYIINYNESGFVFAPFNAEEKAVIIPLKKAECIEVEAWEFSDVVSAETINLNNDEGFQQKKKNYIDNVNKAISKIEAGNFQKVVLSRQETVLLDATNLITLFVKLLNTYKTAFTYCFYHPKVGLWLGASPEIFIKLNGKRLETMSLAGTQKVASVNKWQSKELEEQELVTNFIIDAIKPLVTHLNVAEVETVAAGNLLHLKTNISGLLKTKAFSLKTLLNAMHPTPAVCGLPKNKAKQFILDTEDYDRTYYTGFLGELNLKKRSSRNNNKRNVENDAYAVINLVTELFVNLRCMKIEGNKATIYVGGGITKDSVAAHEWEETVNKSQTMKKILI